MAETRGGHGTQQVGVDGSVCPFFGKAPAAGMAGPTALLITEQSCISVHEAGTTGCGGYGWPTPHPVTRRERG